MDDEKGKFQYSGLKILYDMELVDDPQLINNMKLNIFAMSPMIKDVELLSSYHHKSMLVWIDTSWFGRTFLEKRIVAAVTDRVQQMLPNFRFRVTTNRKIFDLSLERVKTVLKGGNNENIPNAGAAVIVPDQVASSGPAAVQQESGVLQDQGPEPKSGSGSSTPTE